MAECGSEFRDVGRLEAGVQWHYVAFYNENTIVILL